MKPMTTIFLAATAAALTACASVPRNAGATDVAQAVAQRGGPEIRWNTPPTAAENDRIAAILQGELTADQAVAVAVSRSARLQADLAELGIARADLIEASTITNPLFEAEVRFPAAPYHAYEFRIAQTLIDLIQLPRRRATGRAEFAAAQMRVSGTVLRFAADVRSSYYDLVAANEQVELSRTTMAAAQASAELALKQHEAGNITDLDLENEQALYEQAKLDLARAQQQALLARESLGRKMGVPSGAWRVAAVFPDLPPSERNEEQLEQIAAAQRLDIEIARRELAAAQARIPLARVSVLNDLVADYHYQRDPSGKATGGPGIELPIPIFNTGRAARTRAESEYLRARYTLDALQAEAASALRAASSSVAEARARVEYYRNVVLPRRDRILALTILEHNAMVVGTFQLLQAKQNQVQAQRDSIEAQRDYWTARTNLDRALQGTEPDTFIEPATDQGLGKRADMTGGGH